MFSFAEEIYLLALDDVSGRMAPEISGLSLNRVLVGAVLCELSHLGRIDCDTKHLFLVDDTPVGNPVIDSVLGMIKRHDAEKMSIAAWINDLLPKSDDIEKSVLSHLIERGVLNKVEERILWIFPNRRYPVVDNVELVDVERRLRDIVVDESQIPSPRDAVLISLVHACGLFREILSPREFERSARRIETLSKFDLVGHEVVRLIREAQIDTMVPGPMF